MAIAVRTVDRCAMPVARAASAGCPRGKRVNGRVQAFDHCFSSPKSVSLLAAGTSPLDLPPEADMSSGLRAQGAMLPHALLRPFPMGLMFSRMS